MKQILFAFTFFLSIEISTSPMAQSELRSGFSNPPISAKSETWWHWLDGNVSKAGITADLEAMKRVGIAKAQIFNVSSEYPQGPCLYMSKRLYPIFTEFHLQVQNHLPALAAGPIFPLQ